MRIFLAIILTMSALVSLATAQSSICSLPASVTGFCRAYIPVWSYDSETKRCVKFVFGGCGGNKNRFTSERACEAQCKKSSEKSAPETFEMYNED